MLPLDVGSDKVDPQAPTAQMVTEQMNDMVIANAIAHAIRGMPGVLDMGQGLFAKAATYGPGRHVSGIVLQHPTPESLSVEVHVVLEEASFIKAYSEISGSDTSSSSGTTPMLLRFT